MITQLQTQLRARGDTQKSHFVTPVACHTITQWHPPGRHPVPCGPAQLTSCSRAKPGPAHLPALWVLETWRATRDPRCRLSESRAGRRRAEAEARWTPEISWGNIQLHWFRLSQLFLETPRTSSPEGFAQQSSLLNYISQRAQGPPLLCAGVLGGLTAIPQSWVSVRAALGFHMTLSDCVWGHGDAASVCDCMLRGGRC